MWIGSASDLRHVMAFSPKTIWWESTWTGWRDFVKSKVIRDAKDLFKSSRWSNSCWPSNYDVALGEFWWNWPRTNRINTFFRYLLKDFSTHLVNMSVIYLFVSCLFIINFILKMNMSLKPTNNFITSILFFF